MTSTELFVIVLALVFRAELGTLLRVLAERIKRADKTASRQGPTA